MVCSCPSGERLGMEQGEVAYLALQTADREVLGTDE